MNGRPCGSIREVSSTLEGEERFNKREATWVLLVMVGKVVSSRRHREEVGVSGQIHRSPWLIRRVIRSQLAWTIRTHWAWKRKPEAVRVPARISHFINDFQINVC